MTPGELLLRSQSGPRQNSHPKTSRGPIAVFIPTLAGGGAEQVILRLAGAFARRGDAVDLVVLRAEGELRSSVPSQVRLIEIGSRRVLHSVPALAQYLHRERPEVLLSSLNTANVVAVLAARLAPTATRVVIRQAAHLSRELDATSTARSALENLLVRCCYPLADAIIAVSDGVADDLVRRLKISRARVTVLPNPIVTPELGRLARAPLQHPWFQSGGAPVVLSVGRLVQQKRFDVLIHAFARVLQRREVRLMILGEGEDRQQLEALIRTLQLERVVSMPGFVDNPIAYMARASLFVLSSAFEGLPGALIEALACGIPIVATDCDSGPREILQEGRLGRLVPVNNFAALADAILATLCEPRAPLYPEAYRRYSEAVAVDAYLATMREPHYG